jgi:integrase
MKGHIRQRSPGHWAIVIDVPSPEGRRRKWHSFSGTKRDAQKECARLITEVGKGSYVEASKITVGEYVHSRINQWEAEGSITARSALRYCQLLDNQIVPHLGTKPLQKLIRLDLEGWHTALRNGGLSARTIGAAHRLLSKALNIAEGDGLIVKNACRAQRPPKVTENERAIVRDIRGLVEKIAGSRLYVHAIIALFTGMRLGEVLALREEHVDLNAGVIRVREALEETNAFGVRFKGTKTTAGRRDITLPAIVIETLREHRREVLETRLRLGLGKLGPQDLLFSNIEGKPLRPRNVSESWANLAERIGLPEITFHSLRHTHASQLIAQGIDIVTISKRLGHAGKAAAAINAALSQW